MVDVARIPPDRFVRELEEHDRVLDARGHSIWVGAEPTYTDASSESAEWLYDALGENKERRAAAVAATLWRAYPGAALLRPAGRPYAGEAFPRWCHGVYRARDGSAMWNGARDPLCSDDPGESATINSDAVVTAVHAALGAVGWHAKTLDLRVDDDFARRVVFRFDGAPLPADIAREPRLARASVHRDDVEGAQLEDDLARDGIGLLLFGVVRDTLTARTTLRVELPAVATVAGFRRLLDALSQALADARIAEVVLGGHPPPVDASVCWTTVTPDPAVVEVNMAPHQRAVAFHDELATVQSAAADAGLRARRLHYNGLETDSGGGGQVTLGGASPLASPFLRAPSLLPSLVRYFNRHPALSYWWSPEAAGAASQGPRPDEGLREIARELDLALALLERHPAPSPEVLHASLAPFLADASGNAHRSELNMEKLWGDRLGERGRLGLVEFRALRMAPSAELLVATVALLRALGAMLIDAPLRGALRDWGDELHDRYSLPFYLRGDLRAVLGDLAGCGLGLGPHLEALLLDDRPRRMADLRLPGVTLSLSRAVEFWPLIGDVASQERGGARLVDSSTSRIELRLHAENPQHSLHEWQVTVRGVALHLHAERDDRGACRVAGIRYRTFEPLAGLHPLLEGHAPLTLFLSHPEQGSWSLTLDEWRPGGGPYDGLPANRAEAARRRAERCVLTRVASTPRAAAASAHARGRYVLDLRWLEPDPT